MIIMSKQKTVFRASGCGQLHSVTSAQHNLTTISPYRPTCRYCRGSWCTVHGWPSRTRLSISPNMSSSCWTQAPRHPSTLLNSWWMSMRMAREERLTGELNCKLTSSVSLEVLLVFSQSLRFKKHKIVFALRQKYNLYFSIIYTIIRKNTFLLFFIKRQKMYFFSFFLFFLLLMFPGLTEVILTVFCQNLNQNSQT